MTEETQQRTRQQRTEDRGNRGWHGMAWHPCSKCSQDPTLVVAVHNTLCAVQRQVPAAMRTLLQRIQWERLPTKSPFHIIFISTPVCKYDASKASSFRPCKTGTSMPSLGEGCKEYSKGLPTPSVAWQPCIHVYLLTWLVCPHLVGMDSTSCQLLQVCLHKGSSCQVCVSAAVNVHGRNQEFVQAPQT